MERIKTFGGGMLSAGNSVLAEGETCLQGGSRKVSPAVCVQLHPVAATSPVSIKNNTLKG